MTAAIHSIAGAKRKVNRDTELTALHQQAIIAELRVRIAELRRDCDLWRDLAVAWIERRVFDAEQARRLAERAAPRRNRGEQPLVALDGVGGRMFTTIACFVGALIA